MIKVPPIPFRGRRRRRGAPAPAAVVLVAAYYFESGPHVNVSFDRAIDAAGFVGTQFIVSDDAFTGDLMDGTGGVTVLSPTALQISLVRIGTAAGSGVRLTAIGGAGIVAVDDAGAWPGVADLELPYSQ